MRSLPTAPPALERGTTARARRFGVRRPRAPSRARERTHCPRRSGAADGHHPPRRDPVEHLPRRRRAGEARRLRHRALGEPLHAEHLRRRAGPQGQVRVPGAGAGRWRAVRPARGSLRNGGRPHRDGPRPPAVRRERSARRASRDPRLPHRSAPKRACLASARPLRGARACTRSSPGEPLPDGGVALRGARAARLQPRSFARRARRARALGAIGAFRRPDAGRPRKWREAPGVGGRTRSRRRGRTLGARGRRARGGERRRRGLGPSDGRVRPDSIVRHDGGGRPLRPVAFCAPRRGNRDGRGRPGRSRGVHGPRAGPARFDHRAGSLPPGADGRHDEPHGGRRRPGLRRLRLGVGARDGARERHRVGGDRCPLRRGADRVPKGAGQRHRILRS